VNLDKVAFILPSRGLVHSRTIESVLYNLDNTREDTLFISHNESIPDCFNIPIKAALSHKSFTHIFVVEEDIVLSDDTLNQLLAADVDIAFADYPVNGSSSSLVEHKGRVWGGMGAMLVKADVMRKLMPLRAGIIYDYDLIPQEAPKGKNYGHQDVDFYLRAQDRGFTVKCIGKVKHLKVEQLGEPENNNGVHKIKELS
jgi:hypothetical protein